MFFDSWAVSPFVIPVVAIAGGLLVAMVGTLSKARIRELEIRERIAMIERGLVPPPEKDPEVFEHRMRAIDRVQRRDHSTRFRAGGIMTISVGMGLMTLLWFVGAEREGIGIGGFVVIIGLGLLVNSLFNRPQSYSYTPPQPPSSGPSETGPTS
jgi:Domain of unknown function (DUF6249)